MNIAIGAIKRILLLSSIFTLLGGGSSFAAATAAGQDDGRAPKGHHDVKGDMLRGASSHANDAYHAGTPLLAHHHPHLGVVPLPSPSGVSSSSTSSSSSLRRAAEFIEEEGEKEPPRTNHFLGPLSKHDSHFVLTPSSTTMNAIHHAAAGVDDNRRIADVTSSHIVGTYTSTTTTNGGMVQLVRGSSQHFDFKREMLNQEEEYSMDTTTGRQLAGTTENTLQLKFTTQDAAWAEITQGTEFRAYFDGDECSSKNFHPLPEKGAVTLVTMKCASFNDAMKLNVIITDGDDSWGIGRLDVEYNDSGVWTYVGGGGNWETYVDTGTSRQFDLSGKCLFPNGNGGTCQAHVNNAYGWCFCAEGLICHSSLCGPPKQTGEYCEVDFHCAEGLICDSSSLCGPPKQAGEYCEVDSHCDAEAGLTCKGWVCSATGGAEESCSGTAPCREGFDCHPGRNKCYNTPRLKDQPCSSSHACSDDLVCDKLCKAPSAICVQSTKTLMDEVDGSYNDEEATWKAVTGVEKTVIDDFTTNKVYNKVYENACVKKDGLYKELTYEATCKSGSSGDEIALRVIGQPRCYAKSCAAALESDKDLANHLLEQYTLKPTAARASEQKNNATSSGDWTCTGKINDALTNTNTNTNTGSGGCGVATDMMNKETPALIEATMALKPVVTVKKFLFLLPTKEKKVDYGASSSELGNACAKVSGLLVSDDLQMTCTFGEGTASSNEAIFEVVNFRSCLASACEDNQAAIDSATSSQFKDQMFESKQLDEAHDWTCSIGSGAVAMSIQAAVGAALALWWHLM